MAKRTKNADPTWKKTGGGSAVLVIGGKKQMIKPGQVFTAKEEEIPEAFKDVFVLLDKGTEKKKKEKEPEVKKSEYTVVEVDGGFDVIGADEKKVNEAPLETKEVAEELIKTLG